MKDDTISRAAAIDAMMKLQAEDIEEYGASIPEGFDGDRAVMALKALPSATDTNVGGNLSVDELITFLNPESNYVFYDDAHGFCINTQDVIDHLCVMPSAQPDHIGEVTEMVGDVISRQAAIDALDRIFDRCEEIEAHLPEGDPDKSGYKMYPDYITVWKYLHQLPSAQPQRMRGKWTYGEDEYGIDGYHCDKCGFFVPWDYTHKFIDFIKDYHFCPNCGADMRGKQNG